MKKPINIIQPDFKKNKTKTIEDFFVLSTTNIKSFNRNMLPEPLSSWVIDNSERSNMPADYIAISVIVSLSILIGSKFKVYPKQNDDWRVTPNLWGLLIGEPSSGKSPMLKTGLGPINKINAANKTNKNNNRLIAYDSTIEQLGKILSAQENGILLVRDEFDGWLQSLTKKGRESDRAFFLESFNGDSEYIFDRISRSTTQIDKLCISILGGIQPSSIGSIVRAAISGNKNDGLIQRFQLAVWPDKKSKQYTDKKPNTDMQAQVENLFESLWEKINTIDPKSLRFSLEAQKLFKDFYLSHKTQQQNPEFEPALVEHFSKYTGLISSLALIFQIVEDLDSPVIEKRSFEYALRWIDYLCEHAIKIYSNQNGVIQSAKKIYDRRQKLSECFSVRIIKQKCWAGLTDSQTIEAALSFLIENRLIERIHFEPKNTGRPKSATYRWLIS